MKSVLVSRFNWPHKSWNGNYGEEYAAWVEDRFQLFESLTLKSVRNCAIQPDLWIVLIWDRLPHIEPRLQTLLEGLNYKIVKFNDNLIHEAIQGGLADFSFPQEIRMTRLDTDDLIANDFFEQVKSIELDEAKTRDGVIMSFPGGCNYVESEQQFYFSAYPDNPFLTYTEYVDRAEDLKTVYMTMHSLMLDTAKHQIMMRAYHPMWATVVHHTNLANINLIRTNSIALSNQVRLMKKFGIWDFNHTSGPAHSQSLSSLA